MKITLKHLFLLLLFIGVLQIQAKDGGHSGGPVPRAPCITDAQYREIQTQIRSIGVRDEQLIRGNLLFYDPMGSGGTNSYGKTITNYVDLKPFSGLLDYDCGKITYDGHKGTDIEILNFYDMDEGVPVLCAADGVVSYTHDGEYDRNTEWISGRISNAAIVSHSDGSESWYLHMRKNSVSVAVGDSVMVGDTLGFVGSSGFSSGPHIHFEVQQDGTVDPYHGSCQSDSSRWIEQGKYVLDLPFEVMDHGLSTIPLSWAMISEHPPTKKHVKAPGPIYSWVRLRNIRKTDTLTWKFYENGSYWNQYGFSPDNTYTSSWWYVWWNLPTAQTYYGNWTIKIYRNNDLIAQHSFTYDNVDNQIATIESLVFDVHNDEQIDGEFIAEDPDGSIFWYGITTYPTNGTLTQYGGRRRKFTYVPDDGFVGKDSIIFHAIDDENAIGENGAYVFNVLGPLAVITPNSDIPTDFYLSQNYPNPFNPITKIRYDLPQAGEVKLVVFDILGREVKTLVSGRVASGYHNVTWDAGSVPTGIYFIRMMSGDFHQTRKVMVLR